MRTFVLHLTERLHSVETERRSLTTKVNHWQKEAKELKGAVEQTAILSRKVEELENVVGCFQSRYLSIFARLLNFSKLCYAIFPKL